MCHPFVASKLHMCHPSIYNARCHTHTHKHTHTRSRTRTHTHVVGEVKHAFCCKLLHTHLLQAVTHTCTHSYTHVHTFVHTRTHTRTHTYTQCETGSSSKLSDTDQPWRVGAIIDGQKLADVFDVAFALLTYIVAPAHTPSTFAVPVTRTSRLVCTYPYTHI